MGKLTKLLKNKRFKYGGLSVLLTALFIAGVILLNIVAGLILERLDVSIDVSAERIFSIEEETAQFLGTLTDRVTITVMGRETEFAGFNEFYNQTNEILKRFSGASANITLRYLDLMTNPDFAARFGNTLNASSIVFESESTGRHRILYTEDYLRVEYTDLEGNPVPPEFRAMLAAHGMLSENIDAMAESTFLSAILSVTDENPIHVGVISGHNESKNAELELLLDRNAYVLHEINIMTEDLSDELDFILINAPTADYSEATLTRINEWLDNSGQFGKSLIYISPVSAQTPNLDSFLREWGIEVERNYVFQRDSRYATAIQQLSLNVQLYESHVYFSRLNPAYEIYGEFMRHVNQLWEARSNMVTFPLLSSYDGAIIIPFSAIEPDSDFDIDRAETGAFSVAVQSRKVRFEGSGFDAEEVASNVIAFGGGRQTQVGDGNLFNPYFLAQENTNNAEFFISMMNDISGKEASATVMITPKSFSVPTFQITEEQTRTIAVIFIFVLPVLIVLTGIVVWIKRIRT
jgi:hypothetical protein